MESQLNFSELCRRELLIHQEMRSKYRRYLDPGKKVSVITATNKLCFMENIFANYEHQGYLNKELLVILNNNQLNLAQWRKYANQFSGVRVYQLDQTITLGECLNFAINQAEGDYIAKFDDDDYYGQNFLTDLLTCFIYTDAAFVGKCSNFIYFESLGKLFFDNLEPSYRDVQSLSGGTQVIKREVFQKVRFPHINLTEDLVFNAECVQKDIRLYAGDPFNYVRIRHGNKGNHTWRIEDQDYIKRCKFVAETANYKAYSEI